MSRVILNNYCSYPWGRVKNISFRGYFIVNEILYKGEKAIAYLKKRLNETVFEKILISLNGVFSIIIEDGNEIYFATDRLRALPLFYALSGNDLIISDSTNSIYDILPGVSFDHISFEDFNQNGLFVTGRHTLFKEINQVQAGEWCKYNKSERILKNLPYFEYIHKNFVSDKDKLRDNFTNSYKQVGRNLVKALDGRKAIIPLSGGADSRMVATLLKNEGYNDVLCFTYGRKNNTESQISKDVAKHLDYEWIMIPYTRKLWYDLNFDKDYKDYLEIAGNYTGLPHIQDFLAVKVLKERNLIPKKSVFVPGHSGGLIAGRNITEEYLKEKLSPNEFFQTIYRKFYNTDNISSTCIKKKIQSNFDNVTEASVEDLASYSEWFNIRERQAKFIVNSVRVYEYFGYEWLIPLWDNSLFNFWEQVPIKLRYNRKLYIACTKNENIPSTNDPSIIKNIADIVRKIPPLRIIVRKFSKLYKLYFSNNQVGGLYGFSNYFKEWILGDEYFSSSVLGRKRYLSMLKEKDNKQKK